MRNALRFTRQRLPGSSNAAPGSGRRRAWPALRRLLLAGAALAVGSCILPSYQEPCTGDTLDDGNPCTADVCTAGAPAHTALPDGQVCTQGGALGLCESGACQVVPCDPMGDGAECDDKNPCTNDACDPSTSHCAWTGLPDGPTPGAKPIVGDCKESRCVAGTASEVSDLDDVPQDIACVDEACSADGEPLKTPSPAGTACGQLACDGNGICSGCTADGQCPGDTCNAPVCDLMTGTCKTAPAAVGVPVPDPMQTPNDCQVLVCNAMGGIDSVQDPDDVPIADSDPCTLDLCVAGTPLHPPVVAGTECPLGVCDFSGQCVQCISAFGCPGDSLCSHPICDNNSTCSLSHEPAGTPCGAGSCDGVGNCVGCISGEECGMTTECTMHSCLAGGCSMSFAPSGTLVSGQTAGDCLKKVCDGGGMIINQPDNADVQSDNNECTADTCVGGSPMFTLKPAGAPCAGGTKVCNGSGVCVGCVDATDCPPPSGLCKDPVCNAGTCGEINLPQFTSCGVDKQCASGGACKAANGQPCPAAGEIGCASNKCKNGVCCETGCSSSGCIACLEIYTGNPDGDCAGVHDGTDPFNFCAGADVCHWNGPQWSCGP
jgi:hypothetical protein